MNMYTNTKKYKKFILVLICLILFNFCFPKNIKAGTMEDIIAAPAKIGWFLLGGVLQILNNMFADDQVDLFADNGNSGTLSLTPESIIKGKFLIFDANIFKDSSSGGYYDSGKAFSTNGRDSLREIVAGWYYALRNFALIALLSVLVYVAIRMIITSISQDKAKYKTMFKDWLVAICLLILMHYIMISILNICSLITESVRRGGQNSSIMADLISDVTSILSNDDYTNAQIADAYAYLILLGVNIFYTGAFAVKYLKRQFTVIFLILLGPVSCITYPIDKISDGKAQAFNTWFSEFLYEVLIQPFHLLLYIVLMGTAADLAGENLIYSLVCLVVLWKSEDFIKKMFGFKDKLGSPLGAFAGGAMASKAVSALMNKGKGAIASAGGKSGDKGGSTPLPLPPKTVDKPGLVEGNTEGSNKPPKTDNNIDSNMSPGLYEASTQEEDASEGVGESGYNDNTEIEDDSTGTSGTELTGNTGTENLDTSSEGPDATGSNTSDKNTNTGLNTQDNSDNNDDSNSKSSLKDRIANSRAMAIHNQRVSKKYGAVDRKQRWKKRLIKGAKTGTKLAFKGTGKVLKGALIAGAGAAAITTAIATGNGKEALGIAAGITGYAGKSLISGGKKAFNGAKNVASSAKDAAKDYGDAYRDDIHDKIPFIKNREEKEFEAFVSDEKQIDKAVEGYRKNNDGKDPGYQELKDEMRDRYELSRYGLTDDQIDDVLPIYQEKMSELKGQGKSESDSRVIAGSQAKQTAKLAKMYSPKDFQDPKSMKNAHNNMVQQLIEQAKCNNATANEYATKYLLNAARMHGIASSAVALPKGEGSHQTVDIPDMSAPLGIQSSNSSEKPSVEQLERMNSITLRYHKAGFDKSQISQIASSCAGGTITEILDRYDAKIEYLNDGVASEEARRAIELRNNGNNASDEQIRTEMRERLVLKSTFKVESEKDISALRDLETTEIKGKTQIEAAREFAIKNKGQLKDEGHMKRERERLEERLRAGGSSSEKAKEDAGNIINLAGQYTKEV